MSKKQVIMIVSAIVAVLVIVGIVFFVTQSKDEEVTDRKVEKTEGHDNEVVSLLTGEWVDKNVGKNRPIAIMTENTKDCMPQYGVSSAGVIYEAPVEGGITRLVAFYEDFKGLKQLGNVRSCRPYYAYFAKEFDAIYVHFGQSMHAEPILNSGYVDNLSGLDGSVNDTFFRTNEHAAPHNAYTSEEGILSGIQVKGYARAYDESYPGHYKFVEPDQRNELSDGVDCDEIDLYYVHNKAYFLYDDKTKLYKRYQFGGEQVDALNGKQIEVSNVIFQNVDGSIYEGTPYLNLYVDGTGEGKFFTNGKMTDISWKKGEDGITRYYDKNNKEIKLNPGKTWVCIIQKEYADKNVFSVKTEKK